VAKYLDSAPTADDDELAIARYLCLGHPLPESISPYEDRCLCGDPNELWAKYEPQLRALCGTPPEYWPGCRPRPSKNTL